MKKSNYELKLMAGVPRLLQLNGTIHLYEQGIYYVIYLDLYGTQWNHA